MFTFPSGPTFEMTMFGTVWPGTAFRFEASGWGEPVGQTVRNVPPVGPAIVTLSATAVTSPAGISPRPAIWTVNVWPPYAGARPKDWVVVRIDDNNMHQFATESVPHGTIFEFPGGQRVWRTPENTIKTDAPLGAPTGRQGWEGGKPPQLRTDKHGESNQGVPVIESTGVEHQRAHPRGQGTGFELYNHIPLAPTYVNQQLQARGVELYLSELRKARPDLDLRLSTTHKNIPDTTRQEFIQYNLSVVGSDGVRRDLFGVRIWTDYTNKAKPAHTQVTTMPKTAADMDLVTNTVDMGVALGDMEKAIRDARKRKAGK